MAEKRQLRETLLGLVKNLSPDLARKLYLNQELLDQIIEALAKSLREEAKEVFAELYQKAEGPIKELVGRLSAELDEEKVLVAISVPLVNELILWVKRDEAARTLLMSVIAEKFIEQLDLEEFAFEVAEQVAERLTKRVRLQML